MDLEKLETLAKLVLSELENLVSKGYGGYRLSIYSATEIKFKNLLNVAAKTLPEHLELFTQAYQKINTKYSYYEDLTTNGAKMLAEHLLEIIQMEKASQTKIRDMKIFESAEEKLKEAGLCFRKDDYPSTFHSLNTSLELVLKDKLGIPTTITSINTSTVIDVLVSQKIEPYRYLTEVKKHILTIDNKVKHQGYTPSKIECINGMKAMKAMEDLISKLRDKEIEIPEDVRKRIFEGL
jgi:hypothetical protein